MSDEQALLYWIYRFDTSDNRQNYLELPAYTQINRANYDTFPVTGRISVSTHNLHLDIIYRYMRTQDPNLVIFMAFNTNPD